MIASVGGGAAAAAMIAQATKASGVIVRVETADFMRFVNENAEPLVVHAQGGFFSIKHLYLTSYRGLAFLTKTIAPLSFPGHCQIVEAQKIWIPG
jgi:hypothetical protein